MSNAALEEDCKHVSYTKGYVQCFCDAQALEGAKPGDVYDYEGEEYALCKDYYDSTFMALLVCNAITGLIVGINVILKMTTIELITWIGYDTYSVLMTRIVNGVFVVLFFNTGILLVLSNANLSDVSSLLGGFFQGNFYDYSP